jgi:hypothetical protein
VDLVADAVDVRRHLRVPVAATLTEVDACLDEFLNERSHVMDSSDTDAAGVARPPIQGRLWLAANRPDENRAATGARA